MSVALAIHPIHALVPVHTDGGRASVQEEVSERLYVLREGVSVDVVTLDRTFAPALTDVPE